MMDRRAFNLSLLGLLAGCGGSSGGEMEYQIQPSPRSRSPVTDSFQEGEFTPVFTFATPGDVGFTGGNAVGFYTKTGRMIVAHWSITRTLTWTTASGRLRITGFPFPAKPRDTAVAYKGTCTLERVNVAPGFTMYTPTMDSDTSYIDFIASSNDGQTTGFVQATHMVSGQIASSGGMIIYNS